MRARCSCQFTARVRAGIPCSMYTLVPLSECIRSARHLANCRMPAVETSTGPTAHGNGADLCPPVWRRSDLLRLCLGQVAVRPAGSATAGCGNISLLATCHTETAVLSLICFTAWVALGVLRCVPWIGRGGLPRLAGDVVRLSRGCL